MGTDRPTSQSTDDHRVIDLRSRTGYRPNLGAMAQREVAAARAALGLSTTEFAEVLEPLLDWTPTAELVEAWETRVAPPGDVLLAAGIATQGRATAGAAHDFLTEALGDRFSDVSAVYASRTEFTTQFPPSMLYGQAKKIQLSGLSHNLLCQQFPDQKLRTMLEDGTNVQCLFLDPGGQAIRNREIEEGEPDGHLCTLTELNLQVLTKRVRDRVSPEARKRIEIAVYDEPIRFNVTLIDGELCVAQPYLPMTRGLDSPTFIIRRRWPTAGLFPVFENIFTSLWNTRRPV